MRACIHFSSRAWVWSPGLPIYKQTHYQLSCPQKDQLVGWEKKLNWNWKRQTLNEKIFQSFGSFDDCSLVKKKKKKKKKKNTLVIWWADLVQTWKSRSFFFLSMYLLLSFFFVSLSVTVFHNLSFCLCLYSAYFFFLSSFFVSLSLTVFIYFSYSFFLSFFLYLFLSFFFLSFTIDEVIRNNNHIN